MSLLLHAGNRYKENNFSQRRPIWDSQGCLPSEVGGRGQKATLRAMGAREGIHKQAALRVILGNLDTVSNTLSQVGETDGSQVQSAEAKAEEATGETGLKSGPQVGGMEPFLEKQL